MIKEIATGVIMVAAITIGATAAVQGISSNNSIKSNKRDYNTSLQVKNHYDRMTRDLSKDQVARAMVKGQVNLDDAKKDASDRVNNAFNVAYNNVGKDQYGDAKKNITKQLGKGHFSTSLINLINPYNAIPYSNHLEECKIGYGEYDPATHEIPMVMTVKYKATDASKNDSNDYWTAVYNVKTKTFSQDNRKAIVPPQSNQ